MRISTLGQVAGMFAASSILCGLRLRGVAVGALLLVSVFAASVSTARAQLPASALPASPPLPEPIYWKQDLFLIPYQWTGGAGTTAAAVRLFVSQDRGATWSAISEAKPHVKAFNYRAPGEGEYWFAVRTIDAQGRAWPAGAYQPELRVIVDKSVPKIDSLSAKIAADGTLDVRWSGSDVHLNGASWRIEVQPEAGGRWESVAVPHGPGLQSVGGGQTNWRPPAGRRPSAVRATVADLAGNISTSMVSVEAAPLMPNPQLAVEAERVTGWTSAGLAPGLAASVTPSTTTPAAPETLAWPAQPAPPISYRLFDDTVSVPADGATRYGNPLDTGLLPTQSTASGDRYAADRQITPLEPYRQASLRRLPETASAEPPREYPAGNSEPTGENSSKLPAPSSLPHAASLPPGVEPKAVGSRTFALEYELADVGRWGVSRVELWGTQNGGKSWRRYAQDDDLRSPLTVTVDGEGLFGFCIVAESAGGMPASPPQAGQAPELWVEVDLRRPFAELTEIERGTGNESDQLTLRWRAEDENLLPRPVALFYSSRPAGPWSAIAAELVNTGEYAWRVERHVPDRCYLRLEVRDTAGNRAAYQTLEPIAINNLPSDARPQLVGPTDSEAFAAGAVHR
jgi:hypothetical protein